MDIEPVAHRGRVNRGAFAWAAIGAPCLVTGIAALLLVLTRTLAIDPFDVVLTILVFAPIYGAPSYVLFGLPVLWMALRRYKPSARTGLLAGVAAHLISAPAVAVVGLITDEPWLFAMVMTVGAPVAAIWGGLAGWFYTLQTRTIRP